MKLIAKAALLFRNHENPSQTYKVTPGVNPVEVPDEVEEWLEDDDLFQLAVKDGSIIIPQDAKGPAPANLKTFKTEQLVAELQRRGVMGVQGTTLQPAPTSDKARADEQARAEAANKANAGKAGGPVPVQMEPVKQGDEKTSRDDAATAAGQAQAADNSKNDGSDKPDPGTPGAAAQGVTAKDPGAKPADGKK